MSIANSAQPQPDLVTGARRPLADRLRGLNSHIGPRRVPIASAVLVLAGAALGAAMPLLQAPVSVAVLRLNLKSAATAAVAAPRLPEPSDPRTVLRLLAEDPTVRASQATYDAALFNPQAARFAYEPRAIALAGDRDAILTALSQAEKILLAPHSPEAKLSTPSSGLRGRARHFIEGPLDDVIEEAADLAGVDAAFLRATAVRESSNNPYAIASASSARGLYQFINQTWLQSIAKWGSRHGLAREASLIRWDRRGRAYVADASAERAILMLRFDPQVSARMAAESAAENAEVLGREIGRRPSAGELYAAHLLGPGGAVRLIRAAYTRPDLPAALLLPSAAASNPRLFYRAGRPRSVSELLLGLSYPPLEAISGARVRSRE